jgi:5-dehydro-2-deoxygluconokinase
MGFNLTTPVKKSGQDELDFEYVGNIGAFDPTYTKVLVRYDSEGDKELNRR